MTFESKAMEKNNTHGTFLRNHGIYYKALFPKQWFSVVHNFDWLIFHYFIQLMSAEASPKSAEKSDEKLVNQKLC